jgi:hypothetical protein
MSDKLQFVVACQTANCGCAILQARRGPHHNSILTDFANLSAFSRPFFGALSLLASVHKPMVRPAERGEMTKYRRIEVNAFRRRVTIVSGQWPRDSFDAEPAQTDDGVSLNDTDLCEPVTPDSPEGQVILVEAVRSLERRLSPETRAAMRIPPNTLARNRSIRIGLYLKLQSFYQLICPMALRFVRKEK